MDRKDVPQDELVAVNLLLKKPKVQKAPPPPPGIHHSSCGSICSFSIPVLMVVCSMVPLWSIHRTRGREAVLTRTEAAQVTTKLSS